MTLKSLMLHSTAAAGLLAALAMAASAEEITIATVNNGDMIIMQELSKKWEEATGNKITGSRLRKTSCVSA